MARRGEYSKDIAFNQLLEQFAGIISQGIAPDFYIPDNESNGLQFRKAINKEEDAWFILCIIPKSEYHRYYLENCKLDKTQDYCLLGNIRIMDGEEILSNESYLYYFNEGDSVFDIQDNVNQLTNNFKEFLNNLTQE